MRVVVSECAGLVLVFRRASVVYLYIIVCSLLQCIVLCFVLSVVFVCLLWKRTQVWVLLWLCMWRFTGEYRFLMFAPYMVDEGSIGGALLMSNATVMLRSSGRFWLKPVVIVLLMDTV